ncbi:MAG: hypothetical protein OEU50_20245, partial [Gammaproteobacteria bacterium]|nr:hypothetical protein [Gammaproteobacteria bacterium]
EGGGQEGGGQEGGGQKNGTKKVSCLGKSCVRRKRSRRKFSLPGQAQVKLASASELSVPETHASGLYAAAAACESSQAGDPK